MTVTLGSKTTVKNLITALLEMPMDSTVEICTVNNNDADYVEITNIYTDEYNGNKKVILASK